MAHIFYLYCKFLQHRFTRTGRILSPNWTSRSQFLWWPWSSGPSCKAASGLCRPESLSWSPVSSGERRGSVWESVPDLCPKPRGCEVIFKTNISERRLRSRTGRVSSRSKEVPRLLCTWTAPLLLERTRKPRRRNRGLGPGSRKTDLAENFLWGGGGEGAASGH